MKKSAFLMALTIAAGMASCAQGPKANMKNEVDTLSYMMGVSNTQGLQDYALGRMGIDSAHYADFVRGIEAWYRARYERNRCKRKSLPYGSANRPTSKRTNVRCH